MFRTLISGGLAVVLLTATPSVAETAATAANADHDVDVPVSGGALVHEVRPGEHLHGIAGRYRDRAGWYSRSDCLQAIRQANGLEESDLLRPGDALRVPLAEPGPVAQVVAPSRAGADLRGLYLPATVCGRRSVFAHVDRWIAAGGNGVVFDAKDIDGGVAYASRQPLASYGEGCLGPSIPDLVDFVERLHARGIWVVARLALFLDGRLGDRRGDLALADSLGAVWSERGCVWMDPADPTVRAYNLGLALELAQAGVDEIQVDYVRFPTNGWRGDWQGDLAATAARRREVVTSFVATLHDSLASRGTQLSAAVFGIAAWDRTADQALTGQHLVSLAPHLDILCPMIYPSHFRAGFEGLARPADEPRLVITTAVARSVDLVGEGPVVRPWLQAFGWKVEAYDRSYVQTQIRAAEAAGASGWCLWNPSGRYEVALGDVSRH